MKITDLFSSKEEWDHLDSKMIDNMIIQFKKDKQLFYDDLRTRLRMVHSKKSIEVLLEFNIHLEKELIEAAPFIAADLNRIFLLIIQLHYYSYIPQLITLMEICGSRELLDHLKRLINSPDLSRVLNHLEIYQIKKTIYTLSNRFSEKDELIYKIEMELTEMDMEWKNDIEI